MTEQEALKEFEKMAFPKPDYMGEDEHRNIIDRSLFKNALTIEMWRKTMIEGMNEGIEKGYSYEELVSKFQEHVKTLQKGFN